MVGILSKLRGLTRAQEFEKTIPELVSEIAREEKLLNGLNSGKGAAFFEKTSAEVSTINQEIRAAEDRIADLNLALTETKKRHEKAAHDEFMAGVERRMVEARETNKLLRDDYIEIHNLASALADRLRQAKERSIAIQNANAFAVEAKRPELKVLPVIKALARHLGVTTDMVSTGGSNFVHDPIKGFVMPEYYPNESVKFGKRLAALKDVEV